MSKRKVYKVFGFGVTVILLVGIVAFFGRVSNAKWVGHTDLQVRFVVSDAETDRPIPNAIVHIRSERGGFCEDRDERELTIATDQNGHAEHLSKNCMCFGSKGPFEDTFALHLPYWWFHATAEGYSSTEPSFLDAPENAHLVKRGKPFATIVVPIRMRINATLLPND